MRLVLFAVVAAVVLVPVGAHADATDGVYAGVHGGYHDFSEGGGAVFGGYVGFNAPLGETLVVGLEGNASAGTGDIKSEYGASAHLGTAIGSNSVLFARGGIQAIGIEGGGNGDDTYVDFLAGVGGEFGLGEKAAIRITVDTIGFNTVRGLAGITYRF